MSKVRRGAIWRKKGQAKKLEQGKEVEKNKELEYFIAYWNAPVDGNAQWSWRSTVTGGEAELPFTTLASATTSSVETSSEIIYYECTVVQYSVEEGVLNFQIRHRWRFKKSQPTNQAGLPMWFGGRT